MIMINIYLAKAIYIVGDGGGGKSETQTEALREKCMKNITVSIVSKIKKIFLIISQGKACLYVSFTII